MNRMRSQVDNIDVGLLGITLAAEQPKPVKNGELWLALEEALGERDGDPVVAVVKLLVVA